MSEMDENEKDAGGQEGDPQDKDVQTTETDDGTNEDENNGDQGSGNDELSKIQQALAAANKESATRRHTIKDLETKLKELERKDMDEKERLTAQLADLQDADTARDALKEQVEALETAVKSQVEALVKDLNVPKHITPLLDSMSPAEQLKYLSDNRKHFTQTNKKPDIDAGSRGKGSKTKETAEERAKRLKQRFPSLNRR